MLFRFFLLLLLPTLLSFSGPESLVEWKTEIDHDFGDILQGIPVSVDFEFKNLSDELLTIDNVRTTCGCTASDWSEIPTEPGAIGSIHIEFDARKTGYFYKKIKVFFHGQRKGETLSISGYVEAKE